jgi:hypothetical protein
MAQSSLQMFDSDDEWNQRVSRLIQSLVDGYVVAGEAIAGITEANRAAIAKHSVEPEDE